MKTKYFLGVHYGIWITLIIINVFNVILYMQYKEVEKERMNKEIFIESNSVGCSRWQYNGNRYWKCPDKSIISVEVNGYKGYTKQEPVVK